MANKIDVTGKQKIIVAGYPKSGNTWLVRMLCDVLQSPEVSEEGNDITTSADKEKIISNLASSKYALRKSHLKPDKLFESFDQETTKIVFIYRDVRDVITSGFFYFKYKGDKEFVKTKSIKAMLTSPFSIFKSIDARRRFDKYLANFSEVGVGAKYLERYGIWDKHMELWEAVKEADKNNNVAFVSYEDLLEDTYSNIVRIFDEWAIDRPSEEALKSGIEKQTFKNMKKRFEELPDDSSIRHGKSHHVRFLRKGASGDWQNYFTEKNIKAVEKDFGAMLRKKRYLK